MENKNFDCIVIGIGSMGCSAAYYLSKAGLSVLGLEQFSIPNNMGSHSGETRLIRMAYFEHPDYVPLLQKTYTNWRSIERESGEKLYYENGLAYYGNDEDSLIKGVRHSSEQYNIPLENIKSGGYFNLENRSVGIFEEKAGFLVTEKSISAISNLAKKNGAVLKNNEEVVEWKKKGGKIEVITNKCTYTCKKLIITAGSYLPELVPGLSVNVKVTRQLLGWFKPMKLDDYYPEKFPCWVITRRDGGIYYGFPYFEGSLYKGIKAAIHYPGEIIDPKNKKEDYNTVSEGLESLREEMFNILPGMDPELLAWESCRYTMTPDEHFIIDFLPETDNQVVVAGGFSGHGFKFVPVVGEILADLVVSGKSTFNLGMFSLSRFAK